MKTNPKAIVKLIFKTKCKKLTHICLQASGTKKDITFHFSIMKTNFYVCLIPSYATIYNFLINLTFSYPLKYCLLQYKVSKCISYKYVLQTKAHAISHQSNQQILPLLVVRYCSKLLSYVI